MQEQVPPLAWGQICSEEAIKSQLDLDGKHSMCDFPPASSHKSEPASWLLSPHEDFFDSIPFLITITGEQKNVDEEAAIVGLDEEERRQRLDKETGR
jgi:hypothetical protein